MDKYTYQDDGTRATVFATVKRVVVKVGTRLLRDTSSNDTSQRIKQLVQALQVLRQRGLEVLLVSSGAVGFGMTALQTEKRPRKIAELQAHAAVGQSLMMRCYEDACEELGFHCAQILLTAADLHDLDRNRHVVQCLNALLEAQVLPIINENDSVCVDEIKVGDNDTLAAYVATMLRADLTILLTTIDGLKENLPGQKSLGPRISVVPELTPEIIQMARGTDGNQFSVGGMITKLKAAQIVTACGEPLIIAHGEDFSILEQIFSGEDVGTIFLPGRKQRMHARQRFLAFFSEPTGCLVVDAGAEKALCQRNTSLLPGGILGVSGAFQRGDTVKIVNTARQELARGIVNLAYDEVVRICGAKSADLDKCLGHAVDTKVVVHRDYLVLTCS
jgi:glutamate 5-kinase